MLYFLIALALFFDFTNGANDSASIVATVISSRAMRPRNAMLMTALAEFIAPFLFGVAVANTIGNGLIDPQAISLSVVIAAVLAAVVWNLFTRFAGIPSSSSHALIGGLLGAAILSKGFAVVHWPGLVKILIALFLAPPLGLLAGFLLMNLTLLALGNATPRVNQSFKRLQVLTALSLALSHGSNDSQKTMGIITLALVTAGYQATFHVPLWVVALSAGAISLGASVGGWHLIRTLGGRIYKIRPVDGFTAQAASAGVILGAALLGGPVSTSQVITSAIMGAGAAQRLNKVRWQVAQTMLLTWFLTIPLTSIVSGVLYFLVEAFT